MSYQPVILPKWFSHGEIFLAKWQLDHSNYFWTMSIYKFGPVYFFSPHPLCTYDVRLIQYPWIVGSPVNTSKVHTNRNYIHTKLWDEIVSKGALLYFKHTLYILQNIYRIVGSRSTSRLVTCLCLFRLLMKGIFGPYVLWPLDKKLIFWIVTRVSARDYTVHYTHHYNPFLIVNCS